MASSTLDRAQRLQTLFSHVLFRAAKSLGTILDLGMTTVRDARGADAGLKQAIVDGPDAMRRTVCQIARNGADWIKVATSGGVLSARANAVNSHFRDDELGVMMTEAEAAHRPTITHTHACDGIKAAIRAGVRSIEHGRPKQARRSPVAPSTAVRPSSRPTPAPSPVPSVPVYGWLSAATARPPRTEPTWRNWIPWCATVP